MNEIPGNESSKTVPAKTCILSRYTVKRRLIMITNKDKNIINSDNFKEIPEFKGRYVSKDSRVYSTIKHRFLSPIPDVHGYYQVKFTKDGKRIRKRVHVLVAEAFIPNPNNLSEVHHIDENPKNNNVDNLMWVTHLQNMRAGTQIQRRSRPVVLTNIKTGKKIYFKSGREARRAGYDVEKVMSDNYSNKTTKGYTVEWDDPKKYL